MIGPISTLDKDTPMPDLLAPSGLIRLMPNSYYDKLDHDSLRMWCHVHARYGVPTVEFIKWLRAEIGPDRINRTIEIGAGSGDLCYYLGVPGTDSYAQTFPTIAEQYAATRQPTVTYGAHVEKLNDGEAIRKHRPRVVVASWVTQYIDPDRPPPPGGGSIFGVHETLIVASGITYILIGNITIHGGKHIMALPHQEFDLPFVRSRSSVPQADRVWIWNR